MCSSRTLYSALIVLVAAAQPVAAQDGNGAEPRKEETEDFVQDVIGALFTSSWNVYFHGGAATHGRYLLQRMAVPVSGERSLRSEDAFTIGLGAGVDFLLRSAFRMSYTFSSSDLMFRTDDGDGSEQLDIENTGTLQRHVAAVEVVRYMFPARSVVTPYGSAGLVGAWWVLDETSPLVAPEGGSTQFRIGALATFGLQIQLSGHTGARFEVATSSVRNPFTGNESYRAQGGVTIDEPTRVSQTDFRLGAVYYFGRPALPRLPAPGNAR
jgi:hypothetical protein